MRELRERNDDVLETGGFMVPEVDHINPSKKDSTTWRQLSFLT